jgi:glutathione synthase/RimK-type ligase-like ATP-grasp enzyme
VGPARGARIAVATCAEVAELDAEGRLLLARLRAAGLEAEACVWDEPTVDWADYDRVLVRSTWDYPGKLAAFEAWVSARAGQLINPAAAIGWNLSKRYLGELERWGFPTVPTTLLAPGDRFEPPAEGEFVIKPAVSVGSRDTARYRASERERAGRHAEVLLAAGREVLVQPYLGAVDTEAETAVVVLGGRASHAIRKGPLLEPDQDLEQGLFRPEQVSPRRADRAETELAEAVVERFAREVCAPTYARVDLLRADGGRPVVLELELIEPSLFLNHHPSAADRLVELVAADINSDA